MLLMVFSLAMFCLSVNVSIFCLSYAVKTLRRYGCLTAVNDNLFETKKRQIERRDLLKRHHPPEAEQNNQLLLLLQVVEQNNFQLYLIYLLHS